MINANPPAQVKSIQISPSQVYKRGAENLLVFPTLFFPFFEALFLLGSSSDESSDALRSRFFPFLDEALFLLGSSSADEYDGLRSRRARFFPDFARGSSSDDESSLLVAW